MAENNHPNYSKRRAWTLFGVWVFFALHIIHWKLNRTTLAPLELNEVLYTVHQGIVTAGFILMAIIMLGTLVFGRFFCSWGCHILSLQDGSAWILKKLHIRSRPIRSRTLVWVPIIALLYLFVWPQVLMFINGVEPETLHVVENTQGQWSSFVTNDFWRNLPPVEIALSTFFIVGFLMIYLLGSRSFCFYGCPYGALFSVADQVAPGRIKLTGDCVQCGTCTVNCTSDILVHREIKEFGMVTNSNCLKDLDCVAGCPENALSFGFAMPPLFKRKFKLPDYKNRYSFTLTEDLLMTVVFILSIFIFRGLYGIIPFLMSVGMGIVMAYGSVLLLRVFTKSSASINGMRLKISNTIKTPGYVFLTVSAIVLALTVHSGFIQYHSYMGQRLYEQFGAQQIATASLTENAALADRAIEQFETAFNFGLVKPVYLRTQLASLYLHKGRTDEAIAQLNTILKQEPENIKAQYRLGVIETQAGNVKGGLDRFEHVARTEAKDPEEYYMKSSAYVKLADRDMKHGETDAALKLLKAATKEYTKNGDAWLAMGMLYHRNGNAEEAIRSFEKGLELEPNSATAHNNLGALYAQSGDYKNALTHFAELAKLQPTNERAAYNLGMMQMRVGQLDDARESLIKALHINPNYALALSGLAKLNALKPVQE